MKRTLTTFALGLTAATAMYAGQAFALHGDMSDYPSTTGAAGASTAAAGMGGSSLRQSGRAGTADDGHLHTRQDELGTVSHRDTHVFDPREAGAERAQAARRTGKSDGSGHTHTRPDEAGTVSHSEFDHRERRPSR